MEDSLVSLGFGYKRHTIPCANRYNNNRISHGRRQPVYFCSCAAGTRRSPVIADKIRHLEFYCDDVVDHGPFKHTRFPMPVRISLDASDQNDEKLLESYLQPALKDFIFYGGPISDTFLEKLQVCISYLLSFIFRNFIS
jgi:hypothetical protein